MQLLSAMSGWTAWQYISSVIDIAILSLLFYKLIMVMRGTRAVQLVRGIVMLLLMFFLSNLLRLNAISWLLNQFWAVVFIALAVIFQPELRRMLERLGRGSSLLSHGSDLSASDLTHLIEEIIGAATRCSKLNTGALIVIERNTGLTDVIETGVPVDAYVSRELLCNIFVVNTPLHDGAAIISNGRIAAAACFLPLTDNPYISLSLGTRHRAAIGISEVSDALVVVVSEETGAISVAQEGKLIRNLDDKQLRLLLSTELAQPMRRQSQLAGKSARGKEAKADDAQGENPAAEESVSEQAAQHNQ